MKTRSKEINSKTNACEDAASDGIKEVTGRTPSPSQRILEQNIELHCMYTLDNLIVISCTETLFLKQAFSVIKIE